MKIKSIRIENFRRFRDQTVTLNNYSCFVGPNGAGKSTVLAALNVFFQEQSSSSTDVSKLTDEDYCNRDTSLPIRITVTFYNLDQTAQTSLSDYVRQNELVVTAEATYDDNVGYGHVHHFGQRLGMEAFRCFFDAEKSGAKAPQLNQIYDELKQLYPDLPSVARSKDDKITALRNFEASNPLLCTLIPSEDSFYGINGTGKLANFIQWVYVPAVKDAAEESQESRNTALGKLISRAVRSRTNFDAELQTLKIETLTRYQELLERNQAGLSEISTSLQRRLEEWAHPNARLGIEWLSDPNKSVVLQQPVAGIKTGESGFLGSMSRMGHGLQRSYLLALLQELANSDAQNAPTLILGVEEPELYQHPPQARHLADVFEELSTGNNQILVTTHSPFFISGDGFEDIRLVSSVDGRATIRSLTFENLSQTIRRAQGEQIRRRNEGLVAKIHQSLQPGIAEMFFARVPILVEGLEEVSYITSCLYLNELWTEFRRLGCHIIPVHGKDKLILLLAIAKELNLPVFVAFDADGNETRENARNCHERDNRILLNLLNSDAELFPSDAIWGRNFVVWPSNLTETVKTEIPTDDYLRHVEIARQRFAHEGGLGKHDLFIAEWVSSAVGAGASFPSLTRFCEEILNFARNV